MQVKIYFDDETVWEGFKFEAPHNKTFHRVDGPAVEFADGTKWWYQNGHRHRIDGPAIEEASGNKFWYQNGEFHREDGPAAEWSYGTKHWFLNGEEYPEKEFNNILKEIDALEPAIGLLDPREWVRNRWKRRLSNES